MPNPLNSSSSAHAVVVENDVLEAAEASALKQPQQCRRYRNFLVPKRRRRLLKRPTTTIGAVCGCTQRSKEGRDSINH